MGNVLIVNGIQDIPQTSCVAYRINIFVDKLCRALEIPLIWNYKHMNIDDYGWDLLTDSEREKMLQEYKETGNFNIPYP